MTYSVETLAGFGIVAAWAAVVIWGIVQIIRSAVRRRRWRPTLYVVGLIGAFALGAGPVMFVKNGLGDVIGLGFLLAAGGGVAMWAVGYELWKEPNA